MIGAARARVTLTLCIAAAGLFAGPTYAARLADPSTVTTLPGTSGVPRERESARHPSSAAVPAMTGPVVDRAGVLSPAATRRITALAHELERKTGAEMAVLTVDSVAPLDAFDYGQRVADAWKLGKKGKDNGLLLLVAVRERKVRFFTGYGLEGILPDGKLGAILDDDVTPRFRAGDYDTGVYAGMRAAADIIAADAGVQLTGEAPSEPPNARPPTFAPLLLYLAFFLLAVYLSRGRRRRRRYFPIFFGGGLPGGFGGGFGPGSGGGGFGGGGRFGGGGAGRGW